MGALDFLKEFEGRVLDAASYKKILRNYELQEENNNQLKGKVERLEGENATLRQQVDEVLAENKELQEKLANLVVEDQFVKHQEFAFKRGQDGKFEPTGYCPNCKSVMSQISRRTYECPKCRYFVRLCRVIPRSLANELNRQSERQADSSNQ